MDNHFKNYSGTANIFALLFAGIFLFSFNNVFAQKEKGNIAQELQTPCEWHFCACG